jgi:cytochrome c peroxidase
MKSGFLVLISSLLALLLAAAILFAEGTRPPAAIPVGTVVKLVAPLGLPEVPIPADNPPTRETIELGRRLYYDTVLSGDGTVSCASCHDPEHAFADGKQVSEGVSGKKGTRNSSTVLNAAYYGVQFWDGRAPSLEKQVEGPVENPVEMGHSLKGVVQRLNADRGYRAQFARAFGARRITFDMVEKAIASFERTLVSGNSPFDRWLYGGDKNAISSAAQSGFEIFQRADKGNCAWCHTVGAESSLFTDDRFHNLGVGSEGKPPIDTGRYAVTKREDDRGAFRTPSLRNVALTAPYMHDGSLKTLKEVVDFYVRGGNANPNLDTQIKPLHFLTGQELADLVAFLESLNGDIPADSGPPTTNAGAVGKER